jgi:hypothetical protein
MGLSTRYPTHPVQKASLCIVGSGYKGADGVCREILQWVVEDDVDQGSPIRPHIAHMVGMHMES